MRVGPLILLLSVSASAATPKVAVLPFSGPNGAFIREQLLAVVCEQMTCVPPSQVASKNHPDWAKVHAAGLDAVLTGSISKSHGPAQLKLELLQKEKHVAWHTSFALDHHGQLGANQDRKVVVELERRLHRGSAAPAQGELAQAAPPAAEPAPAAKAPPAKAPAPVAEPASEEPPPPAETVTAAAERPTEHHGRYKALPPELLDSVPRI